MLLFIIRYGDIVARNARERVFAIVMMLFTFIFYGLMLGKLANILAAYNFRRQHFKQRFAVIRQYLVSVIVLCSKLHHVFYYTEKSLY